MDERADVDEMREQPLGHRYAMRQGQVLSEARQTVKRVRRELGKERGSSRSLSPRQWKRAKRFLRWQGLL